MGILARWHIEGSMGRPPAIRAVLDWADARNKPHQTERGTRVATQKGAVSLGEVAMAFSILWRQLFVKNGLLYRHWDSAETGQDQVQLIIPFEAHKKVLEQLIFRRLAEDSSRLKRPFCEYARCFSGHP